MIRIKGRVIYWRRSFDVWTGAFADHMHFIQNIYFKLELIQSMGNMEHEVSCQKYFIKKQQYRYS